jgi:uncharacterized phiE125 gp8 family phage protein
LPPLISVSSINYVDANGVTPTLWAATKYIVDAPEGDHAQRGRITLAYGETWPVTRDIANAVTVQFIAGYGAAAAVPQGIKQAMLLMIGHWYEHRESVNVGNIVNEMPQSAMALLWGYRALEA